MSGDVPDTVIITALQAGFNHDAVSEKCLIPHKRIWRRSQNSLTPQTMLSEVQIPLRIDLTFMSRKKKVSSKHVRLCSLWKQPHTFTTDAVNKRERDKSSPHQALKINRQSVQGKVRQISSE